MGLSRSVLFEVDGVVITHTGDIGDFDAAWLRRHRGTDLLLLPVGGVYTLPVTRAADLWRALKPRWCVPMHYRSTEVDLPIAGRETFLGEVPADLVRSATSPIELDDATASGVLAIDPIPASPSVG